MTIPRRIVQTSRSRDLPPIGRAASVNLRLLHPDWEYRHFDDTDVVDFVTTEFPEYRALFDSFPHKIQRFDFFRYLAIFRYGGFYFDLDVLLYTKLDSLLADTAVFPFEELTLNRHLRRHYGVDWEIGNFAFGTAPGHPFLAAVIENCVRARKDPAWLEPMMAGVPRLSRPAYRVLNSTGPGLLTRTLVEHPELGASLRILFPDDVRDRSSWHQFGKYGVHLMEGSWRDHRGFLTRRIAGRWEAFVLGRRLRDSSSLGPTRALSTPPPTGRPGPRSAR